MHGNLLAFLLFIICSICRISSDCSYAISLSGTLTPSGQCIKYPQTNTSYMLFCDEFWMKTITWKSNSECLGERNTSSSQPASLQPSCVDTFNINCEILYVDIYENNFQNNYDGYDYYGHYQGECSIQNDGNITLQMPFILNQCLSADEANTSQMWVDDLEYLIMLRSWRNADCYGGYRTWIVTCEGYTILYGYESTTDTDTVTVNSWMWLIWTVTVVVIVLLFIMCYMTYKCYKRRKHNKTYETITYKLKKALVAVVGIAEYDQDETKDANLSQLNGVIADTANLLRIWNEIYGFKSFPLDSSNVSNHKHRYTKTEFYAFLDGMLNKLNDEQHDSFILCLSCHGGEDKIISSDLQEIYILDIIKRIQEVIQLRNICALLIIDACRGGKIIRLSHRVKSEINTKYSLNHDDAISQEENESLYDSKKFMIIYSTTEGTVAQEHVTDGSLFIQSLCEILDKSTSMRADLEELIKTDVNRLLLEKSDNSQHAELVHNLKGNLCLEREFRPN